MTTIDYEVPELPPSYAGATSGYSPPSTFDALATDGTIAHFAPRRVGRADFDPYTAISYLAADRAGERAIGLSIEGRLNFFEMGSATNIPLARGYARLAAHAEAQAVAGNKAMYVRDATTRAAISTLKVPKDATGLAAAAGVACIAWPGVIARFDLATGEERARFTHPVKGTTHEQLVLSRDGAWLAIESRGQRAPLTLLDASMTVRAERPEPSGYARLSPLRFGDAELFVIEEHGRVLALPIPSFDAGRTVADLAEPRFGCDEAPALDFSQRPPHHVSRAAISEDGRVLVCTRRAGDTVDRFDLKTGARASAVLSAGVTSLAVSADGQRTWIAAEHVYLWTMP
jgi:hypothetical protein